MFHVILSLNFNNKLCIKKYWRINSFIMYEEGQTNDLPLSLENNFLFLLVDNSLKSPIHVTVSVWK